MESEALITTLKSIKLFGMAQAVAEKWTMPIRDWKAALNRFSIQFEKRILLS